MTYFIWPKRKHKLLTNHPAIIDSYCEYLCHEISRNRNFDEITSNIPFQFRHNLSNCRCVIIFHGYTYITNTMSQFQKYQKKKRKRYASSILCLRVASIYWNGSWLSLMRQKYFDICVTQLQLLFKLIRKNRYNNKNKKKMQPHNQFK